MLLDIKLYKENELIINEKNIKYQKENEIISFQLENIEHHLDLKQKILERFNDEFYLKIDFDKEKCMYELKTHHIILDIIVDDSFYEQKENRIEIAYVLETDDQKNKIFIEFLK